MGAPVTIGQKSGGQVGPVHTMDEAAAILRISRRSLQELVKRHRFYAANGSRKLFSDAHLTALFRAMEADAECHSSSSRPGPAKPRTGRSAGRTSASLWTEAQGLLTAPKPPGSSANGKRTSNVVSLPVPERRPS